MYTTELKLNHNEAPAKINLETGEVNQIKSRPNNIPKNKHIHLPNAIFSKRYPDAWNFLRKVLTPKEYEIADHLAMLAQMNTNSLEPLSDDTKIVELSKQFSMSTKRVSKAFKTLFNFGVYAKFEVIKPGVPYTKYWVFNPYLSFSGRLIDSDITALFNGTIIEKQIR